MKLKKIKNLILDVDGVLTTGQFLYTQEGKYAKIFGPHDNDGIKLLKKHLNIRAISADKRGFKITKKRVEEDMGILVELVTEAERLQWLQKKFDLSESIYMGDGMHDALIFKYVAYSIAPANAFVHTLKKAHFVTQSKAGEGAVGEACLHILKKFFNESL